MHCGSHAEGIDESEALLAHKREHQIHNREVSDRARDSESAAREAEAIRQRRVTGFKTRPSALASDKPPRRSQGSIHGRMAVIGRAMRMMPRRNGCQTFSCSVWNRCDLGDDRTGGEARAG